VTPANLSWLKPFGFTVLEFFLPRLCLFCGAGVGEEAPQALCPECEAQIEWVSSPLCPRCGRVYESGDSDRLCSDCQSDPPPFARARAAALYDPKGIVGQAIKRFKFDGQIVYLPLLRSWLQRPVGMALVAEAEVLLPVPLFSKRLKERGFNQALELARGFPEKTVDFESLIRFKNTRPQVELTGKERRENVKDAFKVTRPAELKSKNILLIDDLYTTGSTAQECAKVLLRAGAARVDVLTVARVKFE